MSAFEIVSTMIQIVGLVVTVALAVATIIKKIATKATTFSDDLNQT